MLALNYTQSLLNLQEVIVKKVITTKESTVIDIEMPKKPHICPCCSCLTSFVHDYRYQPVKDIPAFGAKIILNYRKRRYVCPHCGMVLDRDQNAGKNLLNNLKESIGVVSAKFKPMDQTAMQSDLAINRIVTSWDEVGIQQMLINKKAS